MRKIFKIGGITLGGILTILSTYLGMLLYPDASFANHMQYGNFMVHANSKYGPGLEDALRDIQAAIETSEIYDPAIEHDIYFGSDSNFFRALHRVLGITYNLSWPPQVSQIITLRVPDFASNKLSTPTIDGSINLRQTLAHEVVHTFQRSKLGLLGVARSPLWKQEGYADFVGAWATRTDPNYDFRASVDRVLRQNIDWMKDEQGNFLQMKVGCAGKASLIDEGGHWSPTCYYISRVLWEYLINVKGLTFDQVMSPEITDIATFDEILTIYDRS